MLLMPSRYEPCGLSQMIAMRYGCVPIVRAAGGLNDTVRNGVTGFVFEKIHHLSLVGAIKAALKIFSTPEKWKSIQRAGMAQDFSWENSAKQYLDLYQTLHQTMTFKRSSGILLHPSSLPGPYGIGDIGPQAYRFVDWLSSTGSKLWQVLAAWPNWIWRFAVSMFFCICGKSIFDQP